MDPSAADAIQQLIGALQMVLPMLQEPTASRPAAAAESTVAAPPPPNLEVMTPVGPMVTPSLYAALLLLFPLPFTSVNGVC
ncbi:hypothetical protein KOW79_005475 [Hemibagrus wyckioides]|uniref:Uncharacterized protein n=1 Tax=Hemibagrus wyckioides TaxID=337641 RepID=A0A9D3SNN3_9TELE|nr:hypothetical protein KOW79_005475 [Hemibagrus wyckioides]